MPIPPCVEDWLTPFFQGRRRDEASEAAVRTLYAALAGGECEFHMRSIARRAGVSAATVARCVMRLRDLGLLSTTSGAPPLAGGAPPHRYQAHWPPQKATM